MIILINIVKGSSSILLKRRIKRKSITLTQKLLDKHLFETIVSKIKEFELESEEEK